MPAVLADARAELVALCARGLDWQVGASRLMLRPADARRAAVLVLFGRLDTVPAAVPAGAPASAAAPVARDLDVLLLRRSDTLDTHPGQIAFPGGRLEASDVDVTAAALREAVEETGLDPAGLEPLGTLPELPVPVSNHVVTPVAAWWTHPSAVAVVDRHETVDVFRMPVADLLDPAHRVTTQHTYGSRVFSAPAFAVSGRLVWGFTAIVLSRMFDELGWAVPWDRSRTVQPY
ncbi:MAG: CoA pyrophosphatase [Microbacteriaceae bacterium]|nr:MAG: CoA pyrophosphatase [Microbacteriaceae bacterium]